MRRSLATRHSTRRRSIFLIILLLFLAFIVMVFYKEVAFFSVDQEEVKVNDLDWLEKLREKTKPTEIEEEAQEGDLGDGELSEPVEELTGGDLGKDQTPDSVEELAEDVGELEPLQPVQELTDEVEKTVEEVDTKVSLDEEDLEIIKKLPTPLTCTAKDLPPGWPTPDSPLVLEDLENFCDGMDRCHMNNRKTREQKEAIRNPIRLERVKAELATLDPAGGTVILTLLNFAYAFLFTNFVCGCEARGIKIRDSMLVITTDQQGLDLARKMGFAVVFTDWVLEDFEIDSNAPENFSKGDYFWLAGMMNVFLADVHSFGYNVLIQDADITWRYDPRPWLHRPEAAQYDVQAMADGASNNRDKHYNGGFLWYRNNCKARAFLSSLSNIVEWILFIRSDQVVINRLLQDPHFSGISVHKLDRDKFINGNRWDPWRIKPKRPLPLEGMVWHASWTHNHFLKMTKFLVIGEWHISNCRWYDPDIIPDFNFTKEFQDYGKDEFGLTAAVMETLINPKWNRTKAKDSNSINAKT